MINLYEYEQTLWNQGLLMVAGCDEAGRGPMAGPLVAAAVVLDPNHKIPGLNDSKKLSAKRREELYVQIMEHAIEVHSTFISVDEVDRLNVYQASKQAMMASLASMKTKCNYVLTDAMPMEWSVPCLDIIKGDAKSASIAAASIIAKVERDHYMIELDRKYPNYGFKKHKGYVTKAHLEAIEVHGICPHHRKSFAPVQRILEKQSNHQ
jgi:ribonuclease HII